MGVESLPGHNDLGGKNISRRKEGKVQLVVGGDQKT